jgi:hypothetical protein
MQVGHFTRGAGPLPILNEEWWWCELVASYQRKHARNGDVWTAMIYIAGEALGDDPYEYI